MPTVLPDHVVDNLISKVVESTPNPKEGFGILLPNNQRQHRTLNTEKDVLPCALCWSLCPVSAALASIFRMDSLSNACTFPFLSLPSRYRSASLIRKHLPLGPYSKPMHMVLRRS